jgi:hypothetical protein
LLFFLFPHNVNHAKTGSLMQIQKAGPSNPLILYNLSLFVVDIPALTTIIPSMCIGTHGTRASGQASPKEASPFHYSPFKILNSCGTNPAPMKVNVGQCRLMKLNEGRKIKKAAKDWVLHSLSVKSVESVVQFPFFAVQWNKDRKQNHGRTES